MDNASGQAFLGPAQLQLQGIDLVDDFLAALFGGVLQFILECADLIIQIIDVFLKIRASGRCLG